MTTLEEVEAECEHGTQGAKSDPSICSVCVADQCHVKKVHARAADKASDEYVGRRIVEHLW